MDIFGHFRKMPEFLKVSLSDLRNKKPAIGHNVAPLDGIRGLAVLMVLMDHCAAFGNHFQQLGSSPEFRLIIVTTIATIISCIAYTYVEKPFYRSSYRKIFSERIQPKINRFVGHISKGNA